MIYRICITTHNIKITHILIVNGILVVLARKIIVQDRNIAASNNTILVAAMSGRVIEYIEITNICTSLTAKKTINVKIQPINIIDVQIQITTLIICIVYSILLLIGMLRIILQNTNRRDVNMISYIMISSIIKHKISTPVVDILCVYNTTPKLINLYIHVMDNGISMR